MLSFVLRFLTRTLLLLVFLFPRTTPAIAQADVRAIAQYPLGVEGLNIVRPYDVSGNSHHGTLLNNTKKPTSSIFRRGWFANQEPCIEKLTTDDATISIPDLYKGQDVNEKGFAVSFWIWVDLTPEPKSGIPQSANIVNMPLFTIRLERPTPSGNSLALYYYSKKGNRLAPVRIAMDVSFAQQGWYYVAVVYHKGHLVSSRAVTFYYYHADEKKYNPDIKDLQSKEIFEPATPVDPGKDEAGYLLRSPFQGKIWNVQFFDREINPTAVNNNRNDAWYSSKKDGSYEGSHRYYAVANALSFYPCKKEANGKIIDVLGSRDAIAQSGLSFVADRFNNAGAALSFEEKGYVSLPPFYQAYQKSPAFDVREGYSISFWTYIDKYLYPPDDASIPYTDKDPACQFFYISKPGGLLGGMASRGDRAVINRYVALNPTQYWNLWLWDPVSFENEKGWYHVVLTQKSNAVRVVLFRPNGDAACRMNYFNSQDLSVEKMVEFGLGFPLHGRDNPTIRACSFLDDVRVFNWPFSQEEAAVLHAYEILHP